MPEPRYFSVCDYVCSLSQARECNSNAGCRSVDRILLHLQGKKRQTALPLDDDGDTSDERDEPELVLLGIRDDVVVLLVQAGHVPPLVEALDAGVVPARVHLLEGHCHPPLHCRQQGVPRPKHHLARRACRLVESRNMDVVGNGETMLPGTRLRVVCLQSAKK